MSKFRIVTLHFRPIAPFSEQVELLGRTLEIKHMGCEADLDVMASRPLGQALPGDCSWGRR